MRATTIALALGVVAAWAAPGAAQPDADANASQHFHRGEAAYAARDYESAVEEFTVSWEASRSPNARLALARSFRELGRFPEAVAAYEATIADAGIRAETDPFYEQTQNVAKVELARILGKVGRLRVKAVPATAEVRLDGRLLSPEDASRSVPVAPGDVAVDVSAPGFRPHRQIVRVGAGGQATASVTLVAEAPRTRGDVPPPPKSTPARDETLATVGWVTAAGGAAGVGAFALFYALASAQHDKLQDACVKTPCTRATYEDLSETGRTEQRVAHVALGVGAAALITGIALILWDQSVTPPADVAVAPGGASLSLRRAF